MPNDAAGDGDGFVCAIEVSGMVAGEVDVSRKMYGKMYQMKVWRTFSRARP